MQDSRTELHKAAEAKDANKCQQLLEQGLDVNALDQFNRAPLAWVGSRPYSPHPEDYIQTAQVLLDNGAEINPEGVEQPLIMAIWYSVGDIAQRYPDKSIYNSAEFSYPQFLIERGADVNKQNHQGQTGLHIAAHCQWEAYTTLDKLLQHGADVTLRDKEGYTPLSLAVLVGSHECHAKHDKSGGEIFTWKKKDKSLHRAPVDFYETYVAEVARSLAANNTQRATDIAKELAINKFKVKDVSVYCARVLEKSKNTENDQYSNISEQDLNKAQQALYAGIVKFHQSKAKKLFKLSFLIIPLFMGLHQLRLASDVKKLAAKQEKSSNVVVGTTPDSLAAARERLSTSVGTQIATPMATQQAQHTVDAELSPRNIV